MLFKYVWCVSLHLICNAIFMVSGDGNKIILYSYYHHRMLTYNIPGSRPKLEIVSLFGITQRMG
jgi:hypothetical protein